MIRTRVARRGSRINRAFSSRDFATKRIFLLQICDDCWFSASAIEAYGLPAGTYYIVVADENSLIAPALAVNNAEEFPPPPLSLGAYTVALSTTVPEPASLALFGTALLGLALRRRRA